MRARYGSAMTGCVVSAVPLEHGGPFTGSLHDAIYAALRKALIVGELRPGHTFSIRTLAARFGTSLIPARDALRRIVAERGLVVLPNRTLRVPTMTRPRFQELLQVRLSLEPMLAHRATGALSATALRELDVINEDMQAAVPQNDLKRYLTANHQFHFTLYRAAGSEIAFPIVESLWMQVGPFLNGVFTSAGTQQARDNHGEVLKALRRHDPVAAAAATARDLADAADVILARDDFVTDAERTGALTRRPNSRHQKQQEEMA